MGDLRVGTSGWNYPSGRGTWNGVFYPVKGQRPKGFDELSFYAELIWEARKKRAMATIKDRRREMDWVVVRNRTQHTEARNMRRLDQALTELSKRVGFRIASGLSERVIYRELFPSGLTLLDKGHLGELGTSHLVARQELRQLLAGLNLPIPATPQQELALARTA